MVFERYFRERRNAKLQKEAFQAQQKEVREAFETSFAKCHIRDGERLSRKGFVDHFGRSYAGFSRTFTPEFIRTYIDTTQPFSVDDLDEDFMEIRNFIRDLGVAKSYEQINDQEEHEFRQKLGHIAIGMLHDNLRTLVKSRPERF